MKRFDFYAAVLGRWVSAMLLLSLASCSLNDGLGEPDQVLERAISGVYGKDNFSFSGHSMIINSGVSIENHLSFQGFVVHKKQMYVKTTTQQSSSSADANGYKEYYKARNGLVYIKNNRHWTILNQSGKNKELLASDWNPLYRFYLIRQHKGKVEVDHSQSNPQDIVVKTELDPAGVKQSLLDTLQQSYDQALTSSDSTASGKTEAQFEAYKQLAAAQLKEMKDSLEASSRVSMWINRRTNLPHKMKVTTMMRYNLEGKARNEEREDVYAFDDFGGRFSIPSS